MCQDYLCCRVVTYDSIKAPTYSFALDVTIPESTTVIICALKPLTHMVTSSSIRRFGGANVYQEWSSKKEITLYGMLSA